MLTNRRRLLRDTAVGNLNLSHVHNSSSSSSSKYNTLKTAQTEVAQIIRERSFKGRKIRQAQDRRQAFTAQFTRGCVLAECTIVGDRGECQLEGVFSREVEEEVSTCLLLIWWRTREGLIGCGRLNKENIPSRAYIAFKSEEQLAQFSQGYDGHLFRDKAGSSHYLSYPTPTS